jgi:hypothetical protein
MSLTAIWASNVPAFAKLCGLVVEGRFLVSLGPSSTVCKALRLLRTRFPTDPFQGQGLPHDLLVDELLELLFGEVVLVLIEIEEFLWNRRCGGLIIRVMIGF